MQVDKRRSFVHSSTVAHLTPTAILVGSQSVIILTSSLAKATFSRSRFPSRFEKLTVRRFLERFLSRATRYTQEASEDGQPRYIKITQLAKVSVVYLDSQSTRGQMFSGFKSVGSANTSD